MYIYKLQVSDNIYPGVQILLVLLIGYAAFKCGILNKRVELVSLLWKLTENLIISIRS